MSEKEIERLIEVFVGGGTDWFAVLRGIRAYGDARERAGLERAADLCRDKDSAYPESEWDSGFMAGCRHCADEIIALPVSAPNAGGAKVESEGEK